MGKAGEDLKVILDSLAKWRRDYKVGYISMCILEDGYGFSFNFDDSGYRYEARGEYEPWESYKEKGLAEATAEAKETGNKLTPLV